MYAVSEFNLRGKIPIKFAPKGSEGQAGAEGKLGKRCVREGLDEFRCQERDGNRSCHAGKIFVSIVAPERSPLSSRVASIILCEMLTGGLAMVSKLVRHANTTTRFCRRVFRFLSLASSNFYLFICSVNSNRNIEGKYTYLYTE